MSVCVYLMGRYQNFGLSHARQNACSLIEWLVKDSRVRGIEQGPQDGEREEVCEHEHRRGKGEEPRIVAEELVELRNS